MDYNKLLEEYPGVSVTQLFVILYILYGSITSGFIVVAPVFLNYVPEYRCNVTLPENWSQNHFSFDDLVNITTPFDSKTEQYETCYRYQCSDDNNSCSNNVLQCFNHSADPIKCKSGYLYKTNVMESSIVTQFGLVCDNSLRNTISKFLYLAAMFFGSFCFGYIADRFGRRTVIQICVSINLIFQLIATFVPNINVYDFCRFLISFSDIGLFSSSFVYITEIVSAKWRTEIGIGFQVFFGVGYSLFSLIAFYRNNLFDIQLIWGIWYAPLFFLMLFLPESPRWLFSVNKTEKGIKTSKFLLPKNYYDLDDEDILSVNTQEEEEEDADDICLIKDGNIQDSIQDLKTSGGSYNDLFKRGVWKTTFKVVFLWFVVQTFSKLTSETVFPDGAMEIFSYLISLSINKVGRKPVLFTYFFMAGVGLVAMAFISNLSSGNVSVIVIIVISYVVKLASSGTSAVMYAYTCELFPTLIRNNAVGLSNSVSHIGSALVPFILDLDQQVPWLPNTLFGALSLTSAVVVTLLPETKDVKMIDSLDEAINFYNKN